jgi:hypothetical protein
MDSFLGFERIKSKKKVKTIFPSARDCWLIVASFVILALIAITGSLNKFNEEIDKHSREITGYKLSKPVGNDRVETAWIELHFGNGYKRRFAGQLGSQEDPLTRALGEIASVGQLAIKTNGEKITEIDGVGEKRGGWIVYKNGARTTDPVNKLFVRSGDSYSIEFEKQ